jgi:hypothetical protein
LEVTLKGLQKKWREAGFDTLTGHSSIHAPAFDFHTRFYRRETGT